MSRLKSLILAAGLALASTSAQATTLSYSHFITPNGSVGSVSFMAIEVLTRGRFNIWTEGTAINAQLRIFEDDDRDGRVGAAEQYIGGDVEGCNWLSCDIIGSGDNASILGRWLNVGNYVFAVGDARFNIAEARSGINESHPVRSGLNLSGLVTTFLSSDGILDQPGTARFAVVPLPASGWLLLAAFALLGSGAARRKVRLARI